MMWMTIWGRSRRHRKANVLEGRQVSGSRRSNRSVWSGFREAGEKSELYAEFEGYGRLSQDVVLL